MGNHRVNPFARGNVLPPQTPRIKDAFNRELVAGDLVLLPQPTVSTFLISSIIPEMDPKAPPNLLRVTLVQQMTMHFRADTGTKELILIKPTEEVPELPEETVPAGGSTDALIVATDVIE